MYDHGASTKANTRPGAAGNQNRRPLSCMTGCTSKDHKHQSRGPPVCIDILVKVQREQEPRAAGMRQQLGQGPAGTGTRGRRCGSKSWPRTNENQRQTQMFCENNRQPFQGPASTRAGVKSKTQECNRTGRPSGHETSMPSKSRQRYWPKESKGWVSGKISPCIATDCHLGSSLGSKLEPHKFHDGHHCTQLCIEQHRCFANYHDAAWL